MNTELSTTTNGAARGVSKIEAFEQALINGDISKLSIEDRCKYVIQTCESLGLNHLTNPLQFIVLNGKQTLYATRACTDQLRKINGVSLKVVAREKIGDLYSVSVQATDKTGRIDEATGVVTIARLTGDALANALMKAETKAKRRATLSICGLGFLDESEIETVPGAQRVTFEAPAPPATPTFDDVSQEPAPEELPIVDISAPRKAVPDPRREPARVVGGSPATREELGEAAQAQKQPKDGQLWKLFFNLRDAGHEWPRRKKRDQQLENIKVAAMAITGDETCTMFTVSKAIEAVAARGILALQDPDGSGEAAMANDGAIISFEDDEIPF